MTIRFGYDAERATAAALWLLERHGGSASSQKIIKLAFLCDRMHLALYGRPIFAGKYFAMKDGPVASEFYDDVKKSRGGSHETFGDDRYNLIAKSHPDMDCLSESDIEVLEKINAKYGHLDRKELVDFTHNLAAWSKNYQGGDHSYQLPFEDFFLDLPEEFQDMLDLIRENQEIQEIIC